MGEEEEELEFEFTFNRSIKVESREELITGDAGVMLLRELDERLGLTSSLGESLIDQRDPALIRYTLTELLRQRLYGFVQGDRHQDDIDRTAHDPAMRLAEPFLKRPVGRPPSEGYEFSVELGMYRAEKWEYAQRLVLVVVDRPDARTGQLSLWPEHFFLVTNWTPEQRGAEELLQHYRERETFEDRLAEIKNAVRPSLSSPRFEENEATLLLVLLAHNLLGMARGLLEGESGSGWDAARVRDTLLKTGGRILKHSRRLILAVAQAATPLWNLFQRALHHLRVHNPGPKSKRRRGWNPPPAHAHLCLVLRQ